ncbi:anti-sigma factor family protein [Rhizobium oryzicola]|uniref:Anti-sigma factor n=1 Tax=Rhizobium oryzicola TaxID=1232668 RepID=A0ABT8T2R8_9HYPH|nr:anti-sigma factor [Rhizobium oryzicola]MDO1584438.1 anti-sigma factor [Rhizobium oryzicola]
MTSHDIRPSEDELHAFSDGQLTPDRQETVAAWLADNPEDAARVSAWQAQGSAIRTLFAPYERRGAGDGRLLKPVRHSTFGRRLALAAAAALLFVAGVGTGTLLPVSGAQKQPVLASTDLPDEAHAAYLIYASEVRHPVEVAATEEAHLATWLGKRLSRTNLKVPNLGSLGFHLVGGRLVPVDGQAGALFMYEDQNGQRLTMLVGRNGESRETSFRFAAVGKVETFYWIDNGFGYAVTGEVPRELLRKVAEECYRQFPA